MIATLLDEQEAQFTKELSLKILRHAQLYKLTLVHVVKRLFYPSCIEPDHERGWHLAQTALEGLVAEGKLEKLKGRSEFAKNAYIISGHRIKEEADLSKLWFCCMRDDRRYLTAYEDIKPLFEQEHIKPPYHNYAHAIADVDGGPVLLRLYLCLAEKKNAREMLSQHIGQKAKSFRSWIDTGSYGVAVLVHSEQKKKEIEKLLKISRGGKSSLAEQARFIVDTVPTIQTFPQAIKQHEKESWK